MRDKKAGRREWLDLLSGGIDGEVVLPMLSGSMASAILPGDMLTVRPLGAKKVHFGDIVVFRVNSMLLAHRLIFVFRLLSFSLLVEKGDANRHASIVRRDAIVGRVSAVYRQSAIVLETGPEARRRGRHLATRALIWHLCVEAPTTILKRIAGRDA